MTDAHNTSNVKASPNLAALLRRRWDWLTLPHTSLSGIEERNRSHLLSQMTLTISALSLLASLILIGLAGRITPTAVAVWVSVALTFIIYLANRRGYLKVSAAAFVSLNFLLVHFAPLLTGDLTWLLYTIMLMIVGATLLSIRAFALLLCASLITQGILAAAASMTVTMSNVGIGIIFAITTFIFVVYVVHRTRIEHDQHAALEAANHQLRENEAALEQRVLERTREVLQAKEEAERARERAEHADKVKSQFLANISHELRTPLNAILNFVEFVSEELYGPISPQQRDALQKSLSSGQHLMSLINDLLDMTKIDAGMMTLFIEPSVKVEDIVQPALSIIPTMRGDKPITFVTDIDHDLPTVRADLRRVRQVLLNLLSNAFKFTEQGSVTLSVKTQNQFILFGVSDTGPGISHLDQEKLFNPFTQAENAKRRAQSGTGLGLAISRWLVTAHGGTLSLDSEPGDGAAFYFTLPISSSPFSDLPGTAPTK